MTHGHAPSRIVPPFCETSFCESMMWMTWSGESGSISVEFAFVQSEQVARGLDDHHMEAVADAENRHAVLARITNRVDLSLRAALAEASGHDDRISLREAFGDDDLFEFLGIDVIGDDLGFVGDGAVRDRLMHALVGIDGMDILADDRDVERDLRILRGLNDALPFAEIRLPAPDVEFFANPLVESFLMIVERNLVDGVGIGRGDDAFFLDVAEVRDLGLDLFVERLDRIGKAEYRAECRDWSAP